MAGDKQDSGEPKKFFPTAFFLFVLGVLLVVVMVQNLLARPMAKVAFSHQVEHLVNLQMLVPELSRKVALNDNLVTFTGKFREKETEEGRRRFNYLQLLAANHQLMNEKQELRELLDLSKDAVREASRWFLGSSGLSIPEGGFRVVEEVYDLPERSNSVVIHNSSSTKMLSVKFLQKKLDSLQLNDSQALNVFESELVVLVRNFRSPVLGIGSESIKKELKTIANDVDQLRESQVAPEKKVVEWRDALTKLQRIVVQLNQPVDHIRLGALRSVRQYKELMRDFSNVMQQIEGNNIKLERARKLVGKVIWFFNNKELSTRALEREDPELYGYWFANAKDEWNDFKNNRGLSFKALDQPRTLALEKTFKSEEPAPNYFSYVLPVLPVVIVIVLLYFFFSKQMKGVGGGAMHFGKSPARMLQKGQNKITFQDVAGVEEAKEELVEVVDFLKTPAKFTSLGGRIPKGVLLVGPPGTGKTLIAKAVAGEADRPFFSIAGSDFVEMFVGVGASRIRDMFTQAKKHSPCIIFIDEIDAVGRHRGVGIGGGHDEREQTLNQLLVEMDGFDTNEGIILMAATNRPDVLDKALLRPGRFDRCVVIGLPDIKGRYEILKVHATKIKMESSVDLRHVARSTPGAAGAELENLLNEAALLAARKGRNAVTAFDLAEARDKVLYGKERRSLELGDQEKLTTAYHESGHAIVSLKVKHSDPIDKVTIIPRGLSLGATHFLPEKNRLSYWKKELTDQLAVLMGGRVAEKIFFDDVSSGAQQDIAQATRLARSMVCDWGMSDDLGRVSYETRSSDSFGYGQEKSYSEETARVIDEEVRKILEEAYSQAYAIIESNREAVELITKMLIEFETLDAVDIQAIMENRWDIDAKRQRIKDQDHLFQSDQVLKEPCSSEIQKDDCLNPL